MLSEKAVHLCLIPCVQCFRFSPKDIQTKIFTYTKLLTEEIFVLTRKIQMTRDIRKRRYKNELFTRGYISF